MIGELAGLPGERGPLVPEVDEHAERGELGPLRELCGERDTQVGACGPVDQQQPLPRPERFCRHPGQRVASPSCDDVVRLEEQRRSGEMHLDDGDRFGAGVGEIAGCVSEFC